VLGGDTERVGRGTSLAGAVGTPHPVGPTAIRHAPLTSELPWAPCASWSDRESSHGLVRIIADPLTAVLATGEPAR
jgi:hypothetical protein